MQTKPKLRVLLIYRLLIPSIRLCGHSQMEYLAAQGLVDYRARLETSITRDDFAWADLVILGRLDSWYERKLTELFHRMGKYVLYIIDDDLLNAPPQVSSHIYYRQKSVRGNIERMLALSDAVISPSPLLLQKYAGDHRKGVLVEEPALAPIPYHAHDASAPVKIGFAGSIDRARDIEAILGDVLPRIKKEYGSRVSFAFFGAIPAFAAGLDAQSIPYCDSYEAYRQKLNDLEWDIGLAPMPDTPFHACKHYNKFVEYAAAGITGIFSNVMPYTRLSGHTDACILCENTAASWYQAIKTLLDDRNQREDMRAVCASLAAGEFGVEESAHRLYDQLKTAECKNARGHIPFGLLPLLRIGNAVAMTIVRITAYGWSFPLVAAKKILAKLKR